MRPGAAPLAYPYETNTDLAKNDRSSYTAEMFMADRGFTETERTLARKAARLCIRFRNHQRKHKGNRTNYEGPTAESVLAETSLPESRQLTVMCAGIRIATEWGEDFSKYCTRSNYKSKYSDEDMLWALADLAKELGHTPASSDIREEGDIPCVQLYYKRFGSLRKAQRMAGLEPSPQHTREISVLDEEAA